MPKDRGQEHILDVPYPITAAEVRSLIVKIDKRNRLSSLDEENCEQLATMLSSMTVEGSRRRLASWTDGDYIMTEADIRYRKRWQEAINLLRRTRDHPGSFNWQWNVDKATDILDVAFAEAIRLLDAGPKCRPPLQLKAWIFYAMPIAFTMSEIVRELGGRGGTGRKSIAAQFAELALARIGWRDENGRPVAAAAIARYCAMPPRSANDHNLP